ncbi:MAG: ABC transporter permease subunit, partial [Halarsenatibacteraceae bacterium]
QATLAMAGSILSAAGLSFLGLGAQPPTPEWGSMIASTRQFIRISHYPVTFSGLAIVITVLSLNLFGDGLRDALDPKTLEHN